MTFISLIKIKWFKAFHICINLKIQVQFLFLKKVIFFNCLCYPCWKKSIIQQLFNHVFKSYQNCCALELLLNHMLYENFEEKNENYILKWMTKKYMLLVMLFGLLGVKWSTIWIQKVSLTNWKRNIQNKTFITMFLILENKIFMASHFFIIFVVATLPFFFIHLKDEISSSATSHFVWTPCGDKYCNFAYQFLSSSLTIQDPFIGAISRA